MHPVCRDLHAGCMLPSRALLCFSRASIPPCMQSKMQYATISVVKNSWDELHPVIVLSLSPRAAFRGFCVTPAAQFG